MIIGRLIPKKNNIPRVVVGSAGRIIITKRNIGLNFIYEVFCDNIQIMRRYKIRSGFYRIVKVKTFCIYKTVRNPILKVLDGLFIAQENIETFCISAA